MEGLSTSVFLSMSVLCMIISYVRSELSVEECLKVGFNRVNLQCSSCALLEAFELNALQANCFECCHKDDETGAENKEIKKYPSAKLEEASRRSKAAYFQNLHGICNGGSAYSIDKKHWIKTSFVKSSRPGKFPNLQVKYLGGQMPQIRLIDAEGVTQETLSIKTWDTDTIEEFLSTYLEP